MAVVIKELLIRISTMGEQVVSGAFRKITGDVETNTEALEKARTAYLYLAFGLLATGGMLNRWGGQLRKVSDTMVNSFKSIEYQAAVTSSIIGGMGKHQAALRKEMIELGIATEYSAEEAGLAMQQLAMSGFTATEVLGATGATLRLATMGQMELADAAELTAGVYRGFNYEAKLTDERIQELTTGFLELGYATAEEAIEAEKAAMVSDQLFGIVSQLGYAVTNSATNASELAEALKYVASSAAIVGWEIEDALVGIMVAADNMIKAGISGRALRRSLTKLAEEVGATTNEFNSASEVIQTYDLDLMNADGTLKGFVEIVKELKEGLGDLTETQRLAALSALFDANAVSTWAAAMQESDAALNDRELGLKAAAAKEAIFNKLGYEGTDILTMWREELDDNESALLFLTETMGFTTEQAEDINEVISYNKELTEDWTKVVEDASTTLEIVDERLSTLAGTMDIFTSSMDAMYASFGESLAPVMKKWYEILTLIANLFAQLPGWIKAPIALFIILTAVFMQLAGSVLTTLGSLSMLMAAMVMLDKESVKTMTTQELLAHSIRKVGMAALQTTKSLIIMAVKGFGKLMLVIGPLVLAILVVQHVWQKFGPIAGMVVAVLSAITLAIYYNKLALWMWGKQASKATVQTIGYSTSMQAAAISAGGFTAAEASKMSMTVVSTGATATSAMWIKIAALGNWLYTGAAAAATAATGAMTAAVSALTAAVAASYAAMGPWLIVMLAIAAIMGIIIGAIVLTGKEADKGWGHSIVPDAFETGAGEIRHTVTGLDEDLSSLGMFNTQPSIPTINGPVTAAGQRRAVVIAPHASVVYEGGITLGGDEATLRKFKKMQQEAVEMAVKKSIREAEKEIQRGVMWS